MKTLDRFKILDGTALKIVAMIAMIFDHVGDNFFPEMVWMRIIGRMAMPIFAFCIAEGFAHTHDKAKYLRRMLIFGVVSEVPFDLVTAGKVLEFSHQNIMFTFAWAIIGLLILDKVGGSALKRWAKNLIRVIVFIVFLVGSIILGLDYNMVAIAIIFAFYILREKTDWIRDLVAAGVHAVLRNMGIYWFGLLGFIPILLYNHKRGKGLKWLFYVFYPGHLLLIWVIRMICYR
ncbi:MAG: hypothetical protein J5525_00235 [Lachnospiraceae bacterium]|nr:hypothetical protein [Lachnospiraceae bacterium]